MTNTSDRPLPAGFAATLAAMHSVPDAVHAACPGAWRTLASLLHSLIEDDGMTTGQAATVAAVPVPFVAEYRALVGI